MLFCEARQCQRLGPGIFVCGSWAWRAEYPIQSYLESLLPPPSPHPLKQSKALQYSVEQNIGRSEYPFQSYLKPTTSHPASQNTFIDSILHRSTFSIVNTQSPKRGLQGPIEPRSQSQPNVLASRLDCIWVETVMQKIYQSLQRSKKHGAPKEVP